VAERGDVPRHPRHAYVSDVFASARDVDTVFVAFNHYRGDSSVPARSSDRGNVGERGGNLPDRHCVWSVVEDAVNPDLLFAGTEFGLSSRSTAARTG